MEWQIQQLEDEINELEDEKRDHKDRVDELEVQLEDMEDVISRAKSMCLIWSDSAYMALDVLYEYQPNGKGD